MQTSEELQRLLVKAKEARRTLLARGRTSHVPMSEYASASQKVLEAERSLAAATGDQYAVPLDLGFLPEAAVSAPLLLENESSTILTFNAVKMLPDGSRDTAGTAVIEFAQCSWTSFGYPNDEALSGHPLYGRGLEAYGIFDVHNSHWTRRKTEQNRVAFPKTPLSNLRHLIFSFHDSTFECLCQGIQSCSLSNEPYADIFARLGKQVLSRHDGNS